MNKRTLEKTIELANLALEVANESLWINYAQPYGWEVVVLDKLGYATNHKLVQDLNDKQIIKWIDNWTSNYAITKMWRSKRLQSKFVCYT